MRFVRLGRYRHKSCLDIDIIVLRVDDIKQSHTQCKVMYVNQRNPDMMYGKDVITITANQYLNWSFVS